MKIIEVEQGTPEWLSWRKTVITATDCPAILGSSPWSTAYKCWQRKLGLIEEQKVNDAMERGKMMEPQARASFNDDYSLYAMNMKPAVVESSEFDFLGASLDGISENCRYILEIKCGGAKLHAMALDGTIPDYYQDQMQHQLLVTGAEKCFYYSYDGEEGICIEVLPDPTFRDRFMSKARAFWRCVAFSEPPALAASDYRDMNGHLDWALCASLYQETDAAIKALEVKKEELRKTLIELCGDKNSSGYGIKVMKTVVRGRIAYDDIPELLGLDLDKYRKTSTNIWKIMVE